MHIPELLTSNEVSVYLFLDFDKTRVGQSLIFSTFVLYWDRLLFKQSATILVIRTVRTP